MKNLFVPFLVMGFCLAGVLSYVLFSPSSPEDVEGPRSFGAPRADAGPAQPPVEALEGDGEDVGEGADAAARGEGDDKDGPPDVVVEALYDILKGIQQGNVDEVRRAELVTLLVKALDAAEMGEPLNRTVSAEDTVWAIVRADAGRPLKGVKEDLMWRLAEGFARDLDIRLNEVEPKVAALSKLPSFEAPAGHKALAWETLKGYDFKEGMTMPQNVRAFDKQKVAINGYMIPLTEEERPTEFLLVSTLWDCCYGQPPKINHGIVVTMKGKGAPYSDFPILVSGTLTVGEDKEDGEIISVYQMVAHKVTEQDI